MKFMTDGLAEDKRAVQIFDFESDSIPSSIWIGCGLRFLLYPQAFPSSILEVPIFCGSEARRAAEPHWGAGLRPAGGQGCPPYFLFRQTGIFWFSTLRNHAQIGP